jgi:hypothetical protein
MPLAEHFSLATMLEALGRHVALSHETGLAEDRLSAFLDWTGLEGHLASRAALGADCIVHFARATIRLASGTASLAALWSAQVLAGIKFLFTISERKLLTAIAACELLISHKREKEESNDRFLFFLSCSDD